MTRKDILQISKPGDIFKCNKRECKSQYRKFIKCYHPDISGGDEEVFEHLTKLYHEALRQIENNEWQKSNYIELQSSNGKRLQIAFLAEYDFELGTCYVCRQQVIYVLEKNKEKYYKNYINRVAKLTYDTEDMKAVFQRLVPDIQTHGTLKNGEFYIVLRKTEDVYPLSYFLSYLKEVPGKHLAWIISRLSSLCCYLEHNHLVHNGIDLNSCFVSPKYHSIILLGGWWYSTEIGESLIGTTKEIFDLMPIIAKTNKQADTVTDLESVKQVGRALLVANTHLKLKEKKQIPESMINFLQKGAGNEALEEMKIWDEALDMAYGQRKFIELNITEKDIYSKNI